MKAISFLIKPASGSCNMRCRYCFYEDISSHRETYNMGVMTKEMASRLISWAFSSLSEDGMVSFAFQGGEPTMAGLGYFRHFIEEVKKNKKEGQRVSFSLQTNGYAITEEWAALFKENGFLIGISVDGNKNQHDRYRVDEKGEGTFLRVIDKLKILEKYKVDYNALCVVTGNTDPLKAYSSLKREGFSFLQFIPCLDPYEEERGKREFSLTPEKYTQFLSSTFDLWYRDWKNGKYTSVSLFDDYVHLAMGEAPSSCSVLGRCGGYIVVEADGSIYPCDFYVTDKWRIGIFSDFATVDEVYRSKVMEDFLSEGSKEREECRKCQWRGLCNGGCRRDCDYMGKLGPNYFCSSFKAFFNHSYSRIQEIARLELEYRGRNV